jgi:hypothetical protein
MGLLYDNACPDVTQIASSMNMALLLPSAWLPHAPIVMTSVGQLYLAVVHSRQRRRKLRLINNGLFLDRTSVPSLCSVRQRRRRPTAPTHSLKSVYWTGATLTLACAYGANVQAMDFRALHSQGRPSRKTVGQGK